MAAVPTPKICRERERGKRGEEGKKREEEIRKGEERETTRARGVLVYAGFLGCNPPPWNCHKIIMTGMGGGKRESRERG